MGKKWIGNDRDREERSEWWGRLTALGQREREREREGFTRARLRRQKVDFIHVCKTLEGAETEWEKYVVFV